MDYSYLKRSYEREVTANILPHANCSIKAGWGKEVSSWWPRDLPDRASMGGIQHCLCNNSTKSSHIHRRKKIRSGNLQNERKIHENETLQAQVAEEGELPGECSQMRMVLSPLQDARTEEPPHGLHATPQALAPQTHIIYLPNSWIIKQIQLIKTRVVIVPIVVSL